MGNEMLTVIRRGPPISRLPTRIRVLRGRFANKHVTYRASLDRGNHRRVLRAAMSALEFAVTDVIMSTEAFQRGRVAEAWRTRWLDRVSKKNFHASVY